MKVFVTFEKSSCHCVTSCWDRQKKGHSGSYIRTPEGTKSFHCSFFIFQKHSNEIKASAVYYTWFAQLPSFTLQCHHFRSTWELKASIVGGMSITTSNSSSPTIPKYLQISSSSSSTLKGWHTSVSSRFPEHKQFNTLSFPSALATLFLVFLFIQSSWSLQINRAQLHLVFSHLTLSELVPHPHKSKQNCQSAFQEPPGACNRRILLQESIRRKESIGFKLGRKACTIWKYFYFL